MYCIHCGTSLPLEANYCSHCGVAVRARAATGATQRLDETNATPSQHVVRQCEKCGDEMEEVFLELPDTSGKVQESKVISRIEGSIWWGITVGKRWKLQLYRCANCGYLEYYAIKGIEW